MADIAAGAGTMVLERAETGSTFQLAALDASGVGTWDLDVAADRFRCDATAARFYGLSDEERISGVPIGRPGSMVHPEDRAMWRARRSLSLRNGGLFVIEYRVVSAHGEVRWLLVRGRYDFGADGAVRRGQGIVIDLTESKRDGFAEGQASLVEPPVGPVDGGALGRAAAHALAAHRELSLASPRADPALREAADRLLAEAGLAIARASVPPGPRSTRH